MKNRTIKFRVTELESEIIKMKVSNTGLSISEFMRRISLNLNLKNKLSEEEIICYQHLSKFSDNFRRISNLFKQGDVTGMKKETMETSRIIRKHLDKLK